MDALPREGAGGFGTILRAVRKATPQVLVLAERYGGGVSFSFDSNGRPVWVMVLFGKGARPMPSAVIRKYGDLFPWRIETRSL